MRFVFLLAAALPSLLAAQAPPERWELVPDLRIGSVDDPDEALTQVSDLAIGRGGEIYVGQPKERRVRVYDARGRLLRSLGRRGSGPGEFDDVDRLGWRGDSLWVSDAGLRRLTFFSPAGRVLRTITAAAPVVDGAGYPTGPSGYLADGTLVGRPVPSAGRVTGNRAATLPLLHMDRGGGVLGRFAEMTVRGEYEVIRRARAALTMDLPVKSNSLWDQAPDGSYLVVVHRGMQEGGRSLFRVSKHAPDRRLVFERDFSSPVRPVPREARDSIRRMLADFFVRTGFVRAQGQAEAFAADSVEVPRVEPAVTHLAVGRDGTIWLRREGLGRRRVEWTVLGPEGRIVATVDAPARLRVFQAQRDLVWGVEYDELDVPYVVRYRVRRAGS